MVFDALLKIFFILFSITVAIMDIKKGGVPRLAFIIAFLALFTLRAVPNTILWLSIVGALMGLSIFLLAFFLSKKKLGLADVWYSCIIGFVLGPLHWYMAISIACILGVLYIFILKKRSGQWPAIPFIPFMAIGGVAISIIKGKM
jgi:prepilin signal peptidase PulO-like enzyme (type II secretory pathway)